MSPARALLPLLLTMCAMSGCRFDYFWFFDVLRVPAELCDIQPQGEFCGDEGLPPEEQEGWAVEREGEVVQVFIDEEIWIAVEDEEDDTKLTAHKLEVMTSDPGPCTTTRDRALKLTVTFDALTGSYVDATRTEGGQDCGDSPRGERVTYGLEGIGVGTP
jgi:hypothetical protein